MRRAFLCLGALLSLVACTGAMLPQVSPVQAEWAGRQWPGMGEPQLREARQLYVNRCSGCHHLILPAAHDLDKWKATLDTMAVKAKLNEQQKEFIWRYLETVKTVPE